MCDQDQYAEDLKKYSRRDVGAIGAAVGIAMMLPRAANAMDVNESEVTITTPDGVCDAYFAAPTSGAHPAVLVWPDIFGLRTAFRQMGKRLAESGYAVLVVNPFYRVSKAPTASAGANTPFSELGPLMQGSTPETQFTDAKAMTAWLDTRSEVDKSKKMATTGYCFGGPLVFRTAATAPDRVGAACTFHGAGLVGMGDSSPHLLIPRMKAQFLIAIAESDDSRQPEAKDVLRKSFGDAKLNAEVEVYPAAHGWCPPDTAVYDYDQAEKAWSRMLVLFEKALA
jgi:carboxymethylenebutenolidase